MVGEQQVGEADDGGEHVVEIVRDAAGELADRFHLLLLAHLMLQRPLLGDVDDVDDHHLAAAGALGHRIDEEAAGAQALAGKRRVDRRHHAGSFRGGGERGGEVGLVLVGDEIGERAGGVRPDPRKHAQERRIGAPDAAVAVDRRDGDRRVVEEAGEAHLGGAQRLGQFLAGRAVEHHGAGGARRPVDGHRHAVQQAHRQALAVGAHQVEVDDGGAVAHLVVGRRCGEQRDAVALDDIGELQPGGVEARQVDAQPLGERGVHVDDAPVRFGREEAGRRMVEIVDGVLQFLEHGLLTGALGADVGQRPGGQRLAPAADRQRPRRDAVPVGAARRLAAGKRRRHAHLLRPRAALAQLLGDAVERLGRLRIADHDALQRARLAGLGGADEIGIGTVGEDDAALAAGDQHPLAHGADVHLAEVVVLPAAAETDEPDGAGEQRDHPDDGEHGEQAEDEGLRRIRRHQRQADRHADQPEGEDDQPPAAGDAAGTVDQRLGRNALGGAITHGGRLKASCLCRFACACAENQC